MRGGWCLDWQSMKRVRWNTAHSSIRSTGVNARSQRRRHPAPVQRAPAAAVLPGHLRRHGNVAATSQLVASSWYRLYELMRSCTTWPLLELLLLLLLLLLHTQNRNNSSDVNPWRWREVLETSLRRFQDRNLDFSLWNIVVKLTDALTLLCFLVARP